MSDSFKIAWTVVSQDPLSMEFSKEEYWSGLPFPFPGDLSDPGRDQTHVSCLADRFLTTEPPGKPKNDVAAAKSC